MGGPVGADTLPAGSDLTRASTQAADGATLTLGPGEYPGVVYVKGRALTVKGDPGGGTVLTGTDAQVIAQVVEGGRLKLSHVSFRTRRKDGLAAYINQAQASFADCRVNATVQPSFYVDGGKLAIDRCEFHDLQDKAVGAINQSTVTLTDSKVVGAPQGGVFLASGSQAEITGTDFDKVDHQVITVSEGASLSLVDSRITNAGGRGISVTGGSRADISASRFEKVADVALIAAQDAKLKVTKSEFTELAKTAIHAQQGGELTVSNNRFERVAGAIFAGQGAITVAVTGNRFRDVVGEGPAIDLQTEGTSEVRDNLVIGGAGGIRVAGGPTRLSRNQVVGASGTGIALQVAKREDGLGARLDGNQILGSVGTAVLLDSSPGAELSGNLLLSRDGNGLAVQNGASAILSGNIIAAAEDALLIHASAGTGSRLGDDILIGKVAGKGSLVEGPGAARLAFLTSDADNAVKLDQARQGLLDATAPDQVEAKVKALAALADALRQEAVTLGTIGLNTVDRIDQSFAAAFSVYDEQGQEVFVGDARHQSAVVRPGRYVVEPHLVPSQTAEVTVEPGQSRVVDSRVDDHQVLKFLPFVVDGAPVKLPLAIKDKAKAARALAGFRDNFPWQMVAVSRPGVDATTRQKALDLARHALAELRPRFAALAGNLAKAGAKPPDQRTEDEKAAFNKVQNETYVLRGQFALPARIIAAIGTADDAAILAGAVAESDLHAGERLAVAAYIENRLGVLGTGAVSKLLGHENREIATWAALRLKQFGHDQGDSILLAALTQPPNGNLAAWAAYGLLGTVNENVLAAMRGVLALPKDLGAAAALPVSAYLLAHGTADDHRAVSARRFSTSAIPMLTLVAADPLPLIGYYRREILNQSDRMIGFFIEGYVQSLGDLCPLLRSLPEATQLEADFALEDAIVDVFLHFNVSGRTDNSDRLTGRTAFNLAAGQCRSSAWVARVIYEDRNKKDLTRSLQGWVPSRDTQSKTINGEWYWSSRSLDQMDHAALAEAITAKHPAGDRRDLFLAYHQVATSLALDNGDSFPAGAQRRALVINNDGDPPGALALVVAMRPEIVDGMLRVVLSFDAASHTAGSMANMIDPPKRSFQRYLAGRGRDLVAAVTARRGDKLMPLAAAGEVGVGGFVYQVALDQPDLTDLHLDLDLTMFENRRQLTFGLFDGDYGRVAAQAAKRVALAKQRSDAAPDDLARRTALGDALRHAGRLGDAKQVYEQVLAKDAGDIDLWFTISDMYTQRGRHSDAVTVLEAATAAVPDSGDLRFELANSRYLSDDYLGSAQAFAGLAKLEPGDGRWRWWQAANLFLAGQPADALSLLRDASDGYQARRTRLLRYFAAALANNTTDKETARQQLEAALDGLDKPEEAALYQYLLGSIDLKTLFEAAGSPAAQCNAHVFAGYERLVAGEQQAARERMQSALNICSTSRLEYRLAAAELKRLKGAQ